jgi:hypothetical protein
VLAEPERNADVRARLIAAAEEERIGQLANDFLDILQRLAPLIAEYTRVLTRRLTPASA